MNISFDNIKIFVGYLIDGTGEPPKHNVIVVIDKNNIIEDIFPAQNCFDFNVANMTNLADIADINLSNFTLLPYLIDSHSHLALPSKNQKESCQKESDPCDVISENIKQYMRFGVMAVRDAGDKNNEVLNYKYKILKNASNKSFESKEFILNTAGKAWHQKGRYGKFIGKTPEKDSLASEFPNNIDKGTDHVKIINSGLNSLTEFGKETQPQFDKDDLKAAILNAKKLSLKTMVHANGYLPVKDAIQAGCDSIEHGFFMGAENLKLMAEKQITWVPTACTMFSYASLIKGVEADIAKKMLDDQLRQIELAKTLGVPMVIGTDAGSPGVEHGKSVIDELKLFQQASFSIEQAIRCASSDAANLLGISDKIGKLIPKMPAKFLAVKGTPSNLPDSLYYCNENS